MQTEREPGAAPRRWYTSHPVTAALIVGVIAIAAVFAVLVVISVPLAVALSALALAVLALVVGLVAIWVTLGGTPDPRVGAVCRGLLVLFVLAYFIAAAIPGDLGRNLFTGVSAGSFTGLVTFLGGEYVRQGRSQDEPSPRSEADRSASAGQDDGQDERGDPQARPQDPRAPVDEAER